MPYRRCVNAQGKAELVFAFCVAVGAVALCFVGCGYAGSGAIV